MSPDVFVQIPAYRDRELAATLRELLGRADRPDRFRVDVLWQHAPDETLPEDVRALPGVEVVDVDHRDSHGCNWARARLQDRWDGEPLTLLLDSHHRFVDGWDTLALGMYDDLHAAGVARPLLTAYLPPYEPANDPAGRRHEPTKIYPHRREDGLLTRLVSWPLPLWRRATAPVAAEFASLHFLLTDGGFNRDVRFDPEVYFFGDEVLTGLRAFTWGFDMFHPHRVLGWHSYDRSPRVPHWDDHPEWREQHQRSLAALRAVVDGTSDRGWLGPHRSVADYQRWIATDLWEAA